ncbi:SDR family oxidoreductase [Nonomuraea sp. NPDC059007]|uniref:SDR family oxidoreductase n=1 Tax=Nonomuraea sp. NPDC059007 TaxID=3346692 RepID=UPI0036BD216D
MEKLVLLSGRGEEEAQVGEQIVAGSGVEWTVLRASWFNQNYLLEPVLEGEVVLPAGDIPEPFVDAAVAVLTQDGHHGKIYELTGPRLLLTTPVLPRGDEPGQDGDDGGQGGAGSPDQQGDGQQVEHQPHDHAPVRAGGGAGKNRVMSLSCGRRLAVDQHSDLERPVTAAIAAARAQ